MSERLRLEAEFRDRGVSAGLKKIGNDLSAIRKTPGMSDAHKWLGEFNERAGKFVSEGGGVAGVMSGIGIGGLTAAASVAGLVESFKALAERSADLREVSRQTGLTIDQVNQLQRAGEQLYIDPTKMTAGLETMSEHMEEFRRHMGDLYGQLNQFHPELARKLTFDTPDQQVRDIFNWLSQIPGALEKTGHSAADAAAQQKRWTEAFLGDGSLSRLFTHDGRDFANAMKDAAASAASFTPDMQAKADLLHKSILDFNHEWQDFETSVAPFVFDELKTAMVDFKGVFADIKGIYDWFQQHKDHVVADGLKAADDAFNKKADEVGERWRGRAAEARRAIGADRGEDGNALHRNDEMPAKQRAAEAVRGVDGNALHRNDEMPPKPSSPSGSWLGGLFHHMSFGDNPASFGSPSDTIAEGTKTGVLAAFREMMQQGDTQRANGLGGGLTNASFEGGDSFGSSGSPGTPGSSGSSNASRTGSRLGSLPDASDDVVSPGSRVDGSALDWRRMGKQMGAKGNFLMDHMVQLGLKPFQAAGPLGNSWAESNFKTDAFNPRLERSHGLFQLNENAGRWQPFLDWAKHSGRDPHDPLAQLDYAKVEASHMRGPGGMSVWDAIQHAKSRREATSIWLNYFEKPKVRDLGNRDALASRLERNYGTGPRNLNLPDVARKAGEGQTVTHKGGAEITIKGLPNGVSTRSKTTGLITAVNLSRGPTMLLAEG